MKKVMTVLAGLVAGVFMLLATGSTAQAGGSYSFGFGVGVPGFYGSYGYYDDGYVALPPLVVPRIVTPGYVYPRYYYPRYYYPRYGYEYRYWPRHRHYYPRYYGGHRHGPRHFDRDFDRHGPRWGHDGRRGFRR